ncbi:nucleoside-diphosphate kinase [Candidatus Peregrinibacteria bacterium]|nr:nucleoside-diphosphate kinase [Candidatus Peregrinibacteria bacterium]
MERTLVLIKPDAVQRNLVGDITQRFERKGLKLVGLKLIQLDSKILKEHYAHLLDKPFYPGTEKFMQSSPVVAQCWEGFEAVEVVRQMCGVTNSRKALPGTIRGDFGISVQCNLVHASDSLDTAKKEVPRFFAVNEVLNYEKMGPEYLYAPDEK